MTPCTATAESTPALGDRWRRLSGEPPTAAWPIEPGSMHDYRTLAEHHYLAKRPATVSRVLVVRDRQPSTADRFLDRRAAGRAIAVLIESMPTLSCAARDLALGHRYGPPLTPAQRGALLSREMRCLSRVVVHPTYRGVGLAVRLVRHALATAPTPFTEAMAAMGRVHPFFERAGMTRYDRPVSQSEARLLDAFRFAGIRPNALADRDAVWRRVEQLPEALHATILAELSRFFTGRRGRRRPQQRTDPRTQFAFAADRLTLRPVYFLHDNREAPNI